MTNTNEALDLLDKLTDPELAKKAEVEGSRPQGRSPLRHFKADVLTTETDIALETRRVGNFDQTGFYLDLDVTEVYEANPPVEPGQHRIWVRAPKPTRADGKQNNANVNAEATLMLDSAQLKIRGLLGRKGVVFKEDVHDWSMDQDSGKPDPQRPGRTLWEKVDQHTFYYGLDLSGAGTSSTPVTQASSEPSAAAIEAVLKLLADPGMDELAFQQAAARDNIIKKDGAAISALSHKDNPLIADLIATGKVVRDGATLVAV